MKQISNPSLLRNFCIIAHIDHGKSTLSDRLLEQTGTISSKDMKEQVLDDMDLERERGITIKSHPITMDYKADDGNTYMLNLIDTPGHVDFSYEVSRSLAACEGAVLVVDATQGIEAQTLSNIYLALENDLAILPVINKIDLPSAEPENCAKEITDILGVDVSDVIFCSAKTGEGTEAMLEEIVQKIPPPKSGSGSSLRSLVFDSVFDSFRGAIAYVRVFDGKIRKGDRIRFVSNNDEYEIAETGIFKLKRLPQKELLTGQVGYVIANIKNISEIKIGDTITRAGDKSVDPIAGYKDVKPMVFSGLYPVEKKDYENLRKALEKLKLNDSSITYTPETSTALGFGFRAGFLGLLHMEVVQERLSREFGVDIITTLPNVKYKIMLKTGEEIFIEYPAQMPPPNKIQSTFEPVAKVQIVSHTDYIGAIMKLCEEKRGIMGSMEYLHEKRVCLHYVIPMSEMIIDFFDRLKSSTQGYASMDYEFQDYTENDLIKLEILINNSPVDAFSVIIHRDNAYTYGQMLTSKLKELIPRQMFAVAIQAAIGNKVIARTTVKPYRKDVTSKCYGGDITRKRKLIEKQKSGKKRMKQVGNIEIPQEAFLAVLTRE